MLLACSSCNSRYLVNSADLKPNGRTVKCATCSHEWFQEPNLVEEEVLNLSTQSTLKEENSQLKQEKIPTSNLPSTYIKETNPSLINSTLIVLFMVISIIVFQFVKSKENSIIVLSNFYIQEFFFNIKLIINDLAKLIHQIVN